MLSDRINSPRLKPNIANRAQRSFSSFNWNCYFTNFTDIPSKFLHRLYDNRRYNLWLHHL